MSKLSRKIKRVATFFGGQIGGSVKRLSIADILVNHEGKTMPARDWYGKMFDGDLAKYCKCSSTTIHLRRSELGIPPFSKTYVRVGRPTTKVQEENKTSLILSQWKSPHSQKEINTFLINYDMKQLSKKYGQFNVVSKK